MKYFSFFYLYTLKNTNKMDRPYNQFFVKELVIGDYFKCNGPFRRPINNNYLSIYKFNLYSTGNFDIFEKKIPYNGNICSLIRDIYQFPILKYYNKNERNQDDENYFLLHLHDHQIIQRCTFVPDDFMMRFNTTQTTPLDNQIQILNLIENIFRKNKGNVVLNDFEPIKYIIQQQQNISYTQKRNDVLEKTNILFSISIFYIFLSLIHI